MERVILHCDCNSYYASVESIGRPELKSRPMAVCGDPQSRHGIILAKNEPAKAYGIVTAETVWQARAKCPHLLLLPAHHALYQEYSRRINAIYAEYTDQVEAFSVDESWLDVTGSQHLFGTGREIADALRRRVREELDLTISVGVSFNKVFAKMGSDFQKPDATTVISRENFRELLWPLPARELLFIGAAAAAALKRNGILTIGDIARAGRERLAQLLGKAGEQAWQYAMGLDESRVRRIGEAEPVKSIGNSITFRRDLRTPEEVRAGLILLCDQVASRLRRHKLYATTLQLQIKDPSFKVISRQKRLPNATASTRQLLNEALSLLRASWPAGAPIRLLSVSAAGLTAEGGAQLDLFSDPDAQEKQARLDRAMDAVREKYGREALQFGRVLKQDIAGRKEKPEE